MRKVLIPAIALALPLLASPALADKQERYILAETESGAIRLDKKTGEVSFCKPANGGAACTIAADERQAWQSSADALNKRIEALEQRIARLEGQAANGTLPTQPPAQLSEEEEKQLDKAMRFGETFFRRFMGMAKQLQRDFDLK